MTVFKGYISIIKKCLPMIFLYFIITTSISLGIGSAMKSTPLQSFEATRLNIGIVDEDGGVLASGLSEYIGQAHHVEMLTSDESAIRESLFYHNIDYVVYIPENFEKVSLQDRQQLKVTSVPNAYSAFYIEQRIDDFLNGVAVYVAADYSLTEGMQLILAAGNEKVDVQILDINGNAGKRADYTYLLEYLPYLFITAICSSLSVVIGVFNNKEIRRKMLSSPVSLKRQNIEQLSAFLILGIGFLMAALIVLTAVYGLGFWQSVNLEYFLGNIACFLIVSLALAFGVGLLVKPGETTTKVATIISLLMCFLGGVFVPIYLLSENVKKVSVFLPTYWYETNLQILMERNNLNAEFKTAIFKGYGIQMAFALACIGIVLAIVKYRSQEN